MDRSDARLVGLAGLIAGLSVVGQVVAHLADRADSSITWLAVHSVVALAPVVGAALSLRRPKVAWLRHASLLLAIAALGVAAAAIEEHPEAAALAVPACVVLVATLPSGLGSFLPHPRLVSTGALGLLVLAGLVASPDPRGSGSLRLTGGTLADPQAAIGQADARFLTDTLGSAERFAGARCYFVLDPTGGVYSDVVACGPVLHTSGPEEQLGPWDLYPVRIQHGRLVLDDPETGQAFEPDLLRRPDGLRPPRVDETAATQTLTVSPGFTAQLGDDAPPSPTETEGFLLVGTGKVTARAVASPTTVEDEDGIERHAPDGYRFVAADLVFEDVEGVTLDVLSGQQRVDVTESAAPNGRFDEGWIVAVARDDGVDPVLEVTYRGRGQRLSLTTGERLGGDPLLYSPPTLALGRDVERVETEVMVPAATPYPGRVLVGSYTVVSAQLNVFEPNQGWAPPGQAWLIVVLDDLSSPAFLDDDIALDPDVLLHLDHLRSFTLIGPDGEPRGLTGIGPGEEADVSVVFAVDEATRQVTFRSAPLWVLISGGEQLDVATPPVEIPLAFG